jgi:hypothetical protein
MDLTIILETILTIILLLLGITVLYTILYPKGFIEPPK